jgi:ABC-type nickel/cobalt efflux system permease component RcnA
MKSKQLANVLIKIIGLYICLLAIPSVLSGILAIFTAHMGGTSERLNSIFSYSIGAAVQVLIGVILIIKSRNLAGFWFKNEDG